MICAAHTLLQNHPPLGILIEWINDNILCMWSDVMVKEKWDLGRQPWRLLHPLYIPLLLLHLWPPPTSKATYHKLKCGVMIPTSRSCCGIPLLPELSGLLPYPGPHDSLIMAKNHQIWNHVGQRSSIRRKLKVEEGKGRISWRWCCRELEGGFDWERRKWRNSPAFNPTQAPVRPNFRNPQHSAKEL